MNIKILSSVVVSIVLVGAAVAYYILNQPPAIDVPPPTDGQDTIALQIGEEKRYGNVVLTLSGIENDSRCPADVYCVTAGDVTARLSLRSPDSALERPFGMLTEPSWFGGYFIALTDVYPPAHSNRVIKPEEYRLAFKLIPGERPVEVLPPPIVEAPSTTATTTEAAATSTPAELPIDFTEGDKQMRRVIDEDNSFSFVYRREPSGYTLIETLPEDAPSTLSARYELTDAKEYAEFTAATDAREAPPSIVISVFRDANLAPDAWAMANQSLANFASGRSQLIPMKVGRKDAVLYNADGLYPSSNVIVSHKGNIYMVNGSYRERATDLYRDFDVILRSFSFVE